jgi:hypothetical protein
MNFHEKEFFNEIRATASKLSLAGMSEDADKLRLSFYGSTGGEVYGLLGVTLKQILEDSRLPQHLIAEIRHEISQIDAAYDRIGQPRPSLMKVENS